MRQKRKEMEGFGTRERISWERREEWEKREGRKKCNKPESIHGGPGLSWPPALVPMTGCSTEERKGVADWISRTEERKERNGAEERKAGAVGVGWNGREKAGREWGGGKARKGRGKMGVRARGGRKG